MSYHHISLVKIIAFLFVFSNGHAISNDNDEEFGILSPEDTAKIVLLLVMPGHVAAGGKDDDYKMKIIYTLRSEQNHYTAIEYVIKHGNPEGVKYLTEALTLRMKRGRPEPQDIYALIHYMGLLVRTSEAEKYGSIFVNPSNGLSLQASAKYYSRLIDRGIKVSDKFTNDILRFVPPDNANIDYAKLYENVLEAMSEVVSFENFEESKRVFDELNLELFLSKAGKEKIDSLSIKGVTMGKWGYRRFHRLKDGVAPYTQYVTMSNSAKPTFLEETHSIGLLVSTTEAEKLGSTFKNPSKEPFLLASAIYYSCLVGRGIKISDKLTNDILKFVPRDNADIDYAKLYEDVLKAMSEVVSFENFEESKRVFDSINLELFLSKAGKEKIDSINIEGLTMGSLGYSRYLRFKNRIDPYVQYVAMSNSEARMSSSKIIEPPEPIKEILIEYAKAGAFKNLIPSPTDIKQTANNRSN